MKLAIGFVVLFLVLHGLANVLESYRGEWGLAIAFCVFLVAWIVQRLIHNEGLREIGVGVCFRGLGTASAFGLSLVVIAALYLLAVDVKFTVVPYSTWLAIGMLAQGGLAEELIFRGYLFGHIRRTRGFWRAALLSMIPFAAIHLVLFFTMDWILALAALILSVASSFPYARLFELGGRTIWAPALLHAVTQAGPKLLVVDGPALPFFWMVTALMISWSVFLIQSQDVEK